MRGTSFENQFRAVLDHPRELRYAAAGLIALSLGIAIWSNFTGQLTALPSDAKTFVFTWLALALGAIVILPHWSFVTGFLVSLLCMLTAWRIVGLHDVWLIFYPLAAAFLVYVAMFALVASRGIRHEDPRLGVDRTYWHETVIRVYIGFDLIPHFTEKLFAGPGPRDEDVKSFTELGVPDPEFFVILAGFCELGIAIGIGLGLLTRLAACCSALYFLIATILGHHFFLGFIWASPGGGWEYPVLMIILLLAFVLDGAGPFSVDNVILRRVKPPAWLRVLMVPNKD